MAVVDLREPSFVEDPFPLIERLRRDGPVHQSTLGALLLLRHADSDFVLRDPRFSRNIARWPAYQAFRPFGAGSALERTSEQLLFNLDPPAHTRIRRLVSRAFTPRAVARMEATIRSVAADLLAAATPGEEFDVMTGFAQPFPVRVILGILGLPPTDFADLKRWSRAAALIAEPAAPRAAYVQASTAVEQMRGYLAEAVAARRLRPPGEDMLGILVSMDEEGEALTDDEVVSSLIAMFVAGHETTTNLIGNVVWAFSRNPAAWERLRAEPSLTASAVEELLRYEPPAHFTQRLPVEDAEVGGLPVASGALVLPMIAAANRDPEVFGRPDEIDIARSPNPHLSFGGGIHYCVGAGLARAEGQIAFREMAARWPTLDVDEDGLSRRRLTNLRGFDHLPLIPPRQP